MLIINTSTATIDSYSEKQFAGLLNIPISIHYQIGSRHQFCVSAGLKFGLPILGKYSGENIVLTSSGYYSDYDQT
ncbi:MAG: hypothetical protein LBP63_02110 [Prevotellaceae bacterium]|nr:hypothetical protein [Prevotellaceae bacterium]